MIRTVTGRSFHSTECPPQNADCRAKLISLTYRCSKCSERCLNCFKNQGAHSYFVQGCKAARLASRLCFPCSCLVC